MYSPIGKYLSLAAAIGALLLAGLALANHGVARGFVVMWVLGLFALYCFERECKAQGATPLTRLMPGEYRVEAVLDNRFGGVVRILVSWHVDYGHYEFRLVDIGRDRLERVPVVGNTLVGRRLDYGGGIFYTVHSATVNSASPTTGAAS